MIDCEVTDEHLEYQFRAQRRMAFVDELPQELREVVHDYGLEIVRGFLDHGVTKPKSIRHLCRLVWQELSGAEPSNFSNKAAMDERACTWLAGGGYVVVPKTPTKKMVEASIEALDTAGIAHTGVNRERKHLVRLIHANVAGHIGRKLPA